MLRKCNPLSQLREHDSKIQITHAEHYMESDNLFFEQVRLNNAYWQLINTKNDFLIEYLKVQLSDENKILMDKSMLERHRKYKCCVFIDFVYTVPWKCNTWVWNQQYWSSLKFGKQYPFIKKPSPCPGYHHSNVVGFTNLNCSVNSHILDTNNKQEAQRATYRAPEYNVPPFLRNRPGRPIC